MGFRGEEVGINGIYSDFWKYYKKQKADIMATIYNEYKDYKTAAQRHLMTCRYLVECLSLPDNMSHKPLTNFYKSYLFKNIYYLSGYTIESIINFAIYECINETKSASDRIVRVDELNEPSLSLGFRNRGSYLYVIAYHKFQTNMQVLNILASSKFSLVPVVGGTIYPSYWSSVQPLFDNWEAQVRYRNDILTIYTEQQILDFFKFSTELYTGIRSCITT